MLILKAFRVFEEILKALKFYKSTSVETYQERMREGCRYSLYILQLHIYFERSLFTKALKYSYRASLFPKPIK